MQLFRVSDSCIYKYALSSGALSRNCHLLPHCQHRRGYASFADSQPPALITRLNSLCGARGQSKPLAFPLPDPEASEPCLRGCVPVPVLAMTPLPLPCPLGWRSGRGELAALLGALSPAESLLMPRRFWGILCGSCVAGVLCSFQDLGQGVAGGGQHGECAALLGERVVFSQPVAQALCTKQGALSLFQTSPTKGHCSGAAGAPGPW